MYNIAFAIVLLPLLGALGSFLAETSRRVAQTCVVFSFLAAAVAVFLLGWRLRHSGDGTFDNVFTFWDFNPTGGVTAVYKDPRLAHFQPQFGVHVDALSLSLMVAVAITAFVVQWHSFVAVRGDAEYRRLFWLSSALTAAVLGAVVSPTLFQMLLTWGVSGALAWMLVTHWWQQPEVASGARRAFIVNRIGDLALLLGTIIVYVKFATHALAQPSPTNQSAPDPLAFSTLADEVNLAVTGAVPGVGIRTLVIIAVLFAVAAGVRLAQVPFHVALLDAENAPLPALVFAATMPSVCAVVLLARTYPLLLQAPHLLSVIAVVGGVSALVGAVMALVQRDMARTVLTVAMAQLGLIVACIGAGGFSNPVQMLVTYMAFMTALMFACSNLVRGYRTRDILEMGGARQRMPLTAGILGVCVVAIAGLNLSGYAVLAAAMRNQFPNAGHAARPVQIGVTVLSTLAILALSAALARLWRVTCTGPTVVRRGFQADRVAEAPRTLWRSAAGALIGGVAVVGLGIPALNVTFSHFVFLGTVHQDLSVVPAAAAIAAAAGLIGVAAGFLLFGRRTSSDATTATGSLTRFTMSGGHAQSWVPGLASWSSTRTGELILRTDEELTDGFTRGFGDAAGLLELLAERARTRRLPLYIAGAVIIAAAIVLTTVLFATGKLPRLSL